MRSLLLAIRLKQKTPRNGYILGENTLRGLRPLVEFLPKYI